MEFDHSFSNMRHLKSGNNSGAKNAGNNAADDNQSSELRFKVERRMEFDSTRKRMSILVKDPRDHRYKLYIKGADSEIEKRLKP